MDADFSSLTLEPENTPLRILALGDSYTIGEGVLGEECWPRQLASRLGEHRLPVSALRIIAQTGWTTANLSQAMAAATLFGPFDLVTLLIGVNNQYGGGAVEEYQAEFRCCSGRLCFSLRIIRNGCLCSLSPIGALPLTLSGDLIAPALPRKLTNITR